MSLTREDTRILLESDDTNFYWVSLMEVEGLILFSIDTTPEGTVPPGSDSYVALISDDGNIYRMSLTTVTSDGDTINNLLFTLSPDQGEASLSSIAIQLSNTWYYVTLFTLDEDGTPTTHALITAQADPTYDQGNGGRGRLGAIKARIALEHKEFKLGHMELEGWNPRKIRLTGRKPITGFVKL